MTWTRMAGHVRAGAAVVIAVMVVAASTTAGLQLPSDTAVPGLARVTRFALTPLRPLATLADAFVRRVLGDDPTGLGGLAPAPLDGGATRGRAGGSALPAGGGSEARSTGAGRLFVDHLSGAHAGPGQAYVVTGVPFTARTSAAAGEASARTRCAPTGASVWYRYTPRAGEVLLATTYGSRGTVALNAYRQDGEGDLVEVVCDVDPAGNAQISVPAERGATYLFEVVDVVRSGGQLQFNLDLAGITTRVSTGTGGRESKNASYDGTISGDGRYVAFISSDPSLVHGDTNGTSDVFLHDRRTGVTSIVSVSSTGEQGNGSSYATPAISLDGRFVAFGSEASNLVAGDTNGAYDVFLRDVRAGTTVRVSVASSGGQGISRGYTNELYMHLVVSDDGRWVAFSSTLAGLNGEGEAGCETSELWGDDVSRPGPRTAIAVPEGVAAMPCREAYVHDVATGTTRRVSISSEGRRSFGDVGNLDMTPDGRYVLFSSTGEDLVAGDGNGTRDVFLHDRDADGDGRYDEAGAVRTELVSLSNTGAQGNGHSGGSGHRGHATLSDDARYVAFISDASNLADGDRDRLVDVFIRDRHLGTTRVLSARPQDPHHGGHAETELDHQGHHASISGDGRYVAFSSDAANLVDGDHNAVSDAFVYDVLTGTYVRVSVSSAGEEGDGNSEEPEIAADGRHVLFGSWATNLVEGDRNRCNTPWAQAIQRDGECRDLFVHVLPARG